MDADEWKEKIGRQMTQGAHMVRTAAPRSRSARAASSSPPLPLSIYWLSCPSQGRLHKVYGQAEPRAGQPPSDGAQLHGVDGNSGARVMGVQVKHEVVETPAVGRSMAVAPTYNPNSLEALD